MPDPAYVYLDYNATAPARPAGRRGVRSGSKEVAPGMDRFQFVVIGAGPAGEAAAFKARELDVKKREQMLHQIQRILHEQIVYAPIWDNALIRGVGARVEEGALTPDLLTFVEGRWQEQFGLIEVG